MGPIHGIITWEKKPPLGHIIIIHNIIFVIKFATIIKYTILSLCLLLHATNILYDAFLPLNTYSADTCTSILIFGILWWICRVPRNTQRGQFTKTSDALKMCVSNWIWHRNRSLTPLSPAVSTSGSSRASAYFDVSQMTSRESYT